MNLDIKILKISHAQIPLKNMLQEIMLAVIILLRKQKTEIQEGNFTESSQSSVSGFLSLGTNDIGTESVCAVGHCPGHPKMSVGSLTSTH